MLKHGHPMKILRGRAPAAFRRLCVETEYLILAPTKEVAQPPSGGCVLKRAANYVATYTVNQPPSGGCVLKLHYES